MPSTQCCPHDPGGGNLYDSAQMNHPNLVPLHDLASEHGTLVLAAGKVSDYWTAGQIRRLLLLIARDVESNLGPEEF